MNSLLKIINNFIVIASLILFSCSDDPTGPETAFWPISTPELQGMNPLLIEQAFARGEMFGYVDCILVIRNGTIVAEKYYNGYSKETPHNVKSVSKSFLSAMTGIALRDGQINSLSAKLLDYFSEYVYQSIDPKKVDITVRHLLMMRMGIDSDENIYNLV